MNDDVERRLDALESHVTRLMALLDVPEPTNHSEGLPQASSDSLWMMTELARREPDGAVVFAGHADVPGRGPVRWQWGGTPESILTDEVDPLADTLEALGHPIRLTLLRLVLSGVRSTADLAASDDLASTGQLHHHLRILMSAGWLTSPSRGQYDVPPTRVIPLLAIMLAAQRP